jgi:hypothetical protein
MLAEGSGTTMSQEGWGAAYNAIGTQNDDDANSLTESIVKYAERATAVESKVSELESRLSNLEIGNQQQYAAEAAYFTPQAPTSNIQRHRPPLWYHLPSNHGAEPNRNSTNHRTAQAPSNTAEKSDETTRMATEAMVVAARSA